MRIGCFMIMLALSSAQTDTTPTGDGTCVEDPNGAGGLNALGQPCCQPDGTQYCKQINFADLWDSTTNTSAVIWTNLAGQTPDTLATFNYPYYNNFACAGINGDCVTTNFSGDPALFNGTSGTSQYYGVVASMNQTETPIGTAAKQAMTYYKAFNVVLSRYNCEEQYSHWNCDDCRKAYARWISAIMLPACTSSPCGMVKPYASVCYQVIQKCPIIMGFTCPDVAVDDRDYTLSGGNYMGLSGASSHAASMSVTATTLAMATLYYIL